MDITLKGLTSHQAEKLLEKHGLNEITETKQFTLIKAFLSQFDNLLTILLIAAAGISFFVGKPVDSIFILLIVFLNAFFGLYQEFKAEKALFHLKKLTITNIRVIRNGQETEIDSRYLVPGDIVYVEEGSKIPADGEVIQALHLEINEASLTGESLPVLKTVNDPESNHVFMGTVVAKGRGHLKITKTGDNTKFGIIAKTLTQIKPAKTPLQKKLDVFTKQVGMIGIGASLTVFVMSFIQEKTVLESFIFAVSLAVAAVPEGLPAVMTITLAIGVEKMAKKKAIVRKLNAIEALGSVTLIATDKTGTLTTNQMNVKKIWVDEEIYDSKNPPHLNNHPFSLIVKNGVLCSTASLVKKVDHGSYDVIGDATEGALLIMANKLGVLPEELKKEYKIIDEAPFNPKTKLMTVVVENDKEKIILTKGAPESIILNSRTILIGGKVEPLTPSKIRKIEQEFEKFAKQGLRMIAFSYKDYKGVKNNLEKDQTFLGFVGIADPVRIEAKEAVGLARDAGIKVVMITGDNPLTAEAIGIETGIIQEGDDILTGQQLDEYSDEELSPLIKKVKIFARTSPEHKYRLVKLFQSQSEIVTVTGDGVNDALALKQADVGVAMGITGTDVAKETAHIIITDDNFATLIHAVEEGRDIFNRLKNAIKSLLSCNIGEVIYILTAVIFGLPIFTPLQILYINFVTDGLPAITLAFSPRSHNLMKEKPRETSALLNKKDLQYIFIIGLATAVVVYLSLIPFINSLPKIKLISISFTSMIFVQQFIFIDLWLSHKSLFSHFSLLFKPSFLLGFIFPFILHPFVLYVELFQKIFFLTSINLSQLTVAILVSLLIFVPIGFFGRKIFKI